jgi:phospholipid/cholesterol/gamma-HCH transport system substrate-binding protein
MMRRLMVLALVLSLGGCSSSGLANIPLPGGAPDGPSYTVTVEFTDVLDLVPQAAVKVNDVTVGSVEKIWLAGWTAQVRLRVASTVRLPDNATAAIRQSSLLGEKFVALAGPTGESAQGELSDGDVIPVTRTRRSAEVEELLGALGLLLSGGGLAQLRIINQEVAAALEGRESDAKDALRQLDEFVGGLDAQKADIVRAIDALDRLSERLAAQRDTIGAAVDALGPGLAVLAEQRQQLTGALTALGDLGTVGTRVIGESRDDTVASIAALRPTLDQLVRAGDALPKALDFLLTFPFPPNITGAIVGDQVNLRVTIDADASQILANLLAAAPPAQPGQPGQPVLPNLPVPPLPTLPVPVPSLPLPSLCPLPTPSLPLPLPSLPLPSQCPLPTVSLPVPLPSLPVPLPGLAIARGAAPPGAADGVLGSLALVLNGGLTA